MPQPKDLDPYANPRIFYGAEPRRLREAAGLSQNHLGERVFCSGTYIGLFEAAERRPRVELSRALDGLLGSGEHLERLSWPGSQRSRTMSRKPPSWRQGPRASAGTRRCSCRACSRHVSTPKP
ncbi:multiprotein-bridging factor 1 family protein [Streptomyces sp. NPDC058637]|uniref:helix-turn-helix domain-containing protein n=1 Tax=Streptomyces sp. NPDC058637 TaxID=3346569 RepID=UPI0036476930